MASFTRFTRFTRFARFARLVCALAVVLLGIMTELSCNDPLQDARIKALGPEANGVSPGPTHRPGQPCLTCHDGTGPGDLQFAVAGTVYQTADPASAPMVGATVSIFEATQDVDGGTPRTTTTNEAGNFYITNSDWSTPAYPLHDLSVTISNLPAPTRMHTRIGRDGSCATCHYEPEGPTSPGHIYVVVEQGDLPQP